MPSQWRWAIWTLAIAGIDTWINRYFIKVWKIFNTNYLDIVKIYILKLWISDFKSWKHPTLNFINENKLLTYKYSQIIITKLLQRKITSSTKYTNRLITGGIECYTCNTFIFTHIYSSPNCLAILTICFLQPKMQYYN